MNTHLYNWLLEAFILMATFKDSYNRLVWLEDAWGFFDSMERGWEVAAPNATTYARGLAQVRGFYTRHLSRTDPCLGSISTLQNLYQHQTAMRGPPRCSGNRRSSDFWIRLVGSGSRRYHQAPLKTAVEVNLVSISQLLTSPAGLGAGKFAPSRSFAGCSGSQPCPATGDNPLALT